MRTVTIDIVLNTEFAYIKQNGGRGILGNQHSVLVIGMLINVGVVRRGKVRDLLRGDAQLHRRKQVSKRKMIKGLKLMNRSLPIMRCARGGGRVIIVARKEASSSIRALSHQISHKAQKMADFEGLEHSHYCMREGELD